MPDDEVIEAEVNATEEQEAPTPIQPPTFRSTEAVQQQSTALVPLGEENDLPALLRYGKVACATGKFHPTLTPPEVAIIILAGREKGMKPIEALTSIYLVNGRITYSANALAAFIKRSGKYNYRVKALKDEGCILTFFERIDGAWTELGDATFTKGDADRAGLTRGVNWMKYPRNMMFARAISNGVKFFCPDLIAGGAYVHGEIDPDREQAPALDDGNTVEGELVG